MQIHKVAFSVRRRRPNCNNRLGEWTLRIALCCFRLNEFAEKFVKQIRLSDAKFRVCMPAKQNRSSRIRRKCTMNLRTLFGGDKTLKLSYEVIAVQKTLLLVATTAKRNETRQFDYNASVTRQR